MSINSKLFSGEGLAWLSSSKGQKLIEALFNSISQAAKNGKNNIKLNFYLDKKGWYFKNGFEVLECCLPEDLLEIIGIENFKIGETIIKEKSYSVTVNW